MNRVTMTEQEASRAAEVARHILESRLPSWLRYHDLTHTTELVVPAAELLAADENLDDDDRRSAVTAAWFHDIGFVERYEDNEEMAAALAEEELVRVGVDAEAIALVAGAILSTRLPQRPEGVVAEIVCDADLFVLGTERFFERDARPTRGTGGIGDHLCGCRVGRAPTLVHRTAPVLHRRRPSPQRPDQGRQRPGAPPPSDGTALTRRDPGAGILAPTADRRHLTGGLEPCPQASARLATASASVSKRSTKVEKRTRSKIFRKWGLAPLTTRSPTTCWESSHASEHVIDDEHGRSGTPLGEAEERTEVARGGESGNVKAGD